MDMTRGWRRVDAVDIGIYPAGGADVGRAVIDAVLSYAGAPVPVWTEGQAGSVTGWGRAERVVIEGLGRRYRSAVSTSDHALLPQLIGARTVRFYAGLESPLEHLGLVTLAKMRHAGLISSAEPLAPLLHKLRHLTMQFCGVSGGMTVATRGVDRSGAPVQSGWLLVAKNGHGPNVPVLPALAMTKKLLTEPVPAGASCAVGALSRGEIEAAMAPFDLTVLTSSTAPAFARAA